MTEEIPPTVVSGNSSRRGDEDSIIPGFNPIPPARSSSIHEKTPGLISTTRIYQKIGEGIVVPKENEKRPKISIFKATLMLSNICLGATIFTFGVRAKSFGLFWLIVACIIIGIINYWTIMRGAYASSKNIGINDYSLLTGKILGKKPRFSLNILIILYTYGLMMCFLSLTFPLCGRFVQNLLYNKKYHSYDEFEKMMWGKIYIKLTFFIVITFLVGVFCLIADINKLKYSSYIGVSFVIYSLFIVMVQCNDYYNYYKKTKYIKSDDKTHPNWFNLSKAFNNNLDFFKGMASLFCAYACNPGTFPVFSEFKGRKNEMKNMKYSVFFSTCLITFLHIISIVCSFLTDPYTPEDLVIFRKNKGNGKDIAMTIANLLVALNLILTIPEFFYNLRLNVAHTFTGGKITDKFNYIFTFLSCLACGIIAAFYDEVLNYLIYIGGFTVVFICYLYPILIYVFSTEKKLKDWKNLLEIILAIILCIIGVIAGIATLIDDVKN